MNGTTDTTEAAPAITVNDLAAILIRIAEALEKQNKILENLTHVVRGVPQAIEAVGEYL